MNGYNCRGFPTFPGEGRRRKKELLKVACMNMSSWNVKWNSSGIIDMIQEERHMCWLLMEIHLKGCGVWKYVNNGGQGLWKWNTVGSKDVQYWPFHKYGQEWMDMDDVDHCWYRWQANQVLWSMHGCVHKPQWTVNLTCKVTESSPVPIWLCLWLVCTLLSWLWFLMHLWWWWWSSHY